MAEIRKSRLSDLPLSVRRRTVRVLGGLLFLCFGVTVGLRSLGSGSRSAQLDADHRNQRPVPRAALSAGGSSSFLAAPESEAARPGRDGSKDPSAPTEPADFQTRCGAPGVLKCVGFDSPSDLKPADWPNPGLYPAADKKYHGSFDPGVKASGAGSLRFEVQGHTPPNAAGQWRQDFGGNFGARTTFYVQFRQRFSPGMLTNPWGSSKITWKQVIFHHFSATCAAVELTTTQYYHEGIPIMYTDCGRGLYTDPPILLQQGDYNCRYGSINKKDCFKYVADQWITFYYQVSIGDWDKPNSTIKAWVALDGQPYRQWINMRNFILHDDSPHGEGYNYLTLTPYMTDKDPAVDHPTAYTWYEDRKSVV